MPLTPETIAYLSGALLSLAFEYVPALHNWYNALTNTRQRLLMLVLLAAVTVGLAIYECQNLTCQSWQAYAVLFVKAVVANQATYLVSPKKG